MVKSKIIMDTPEHQFQEKEHELYLQSTLQDYRRGVFELAKEYANLKVQQAIKLRGMECNEAEIAERKKSILMPLKLKSAGWTLGNDEQEILQLSVIKLIKHNRAVKSKSK